MFIFSYNYFFFFYSVCLFFFRLLSVSFLIFYFGFFIFLSFFPSSWCRRRRAAPRPCPTLRGTVRPSSAPAPASVAHQMKPPTPASRPAPLQSSRRSRRMPHDSHG